MILLARRVRQFGACNIYRGFGKSNAKLGSNGADTGEEAAKNTFWFGSKVT